jgi:hypothetical protein
MPSGQLFEIIDGVRRAKACQLAGLTDISAEVIVGGTSRPIQVSLDVLRARFNMIDASSTTSAKSRWDRAVVGSQSHPLPFGPILISPISARRAIRLTQVADVEVF